MTPSGAGRVTGGIEQLVRRGWVTRFTDWRREGRLVDPRSDFNEAARCAEEIIERWFQPVWGDAGPAGQGPC